MKQNIKHIINKILFSLIIMLLFTNIVKVNSTSMSQQLIYQVNSFEEAEFLSKQYDIKILKAGYSGVITYEVNNIDIIPELLEIGFCYNNLSETQLLPIIKQKDPLIDKQYALEMMQTIDAWQVTTGKSEVTVAIIDTGIDIYHEEFEGRLLPFSYNSHQKTVGLETVIDDNGHGTMVAGIIAANKDNYYGIAGIAQNVQLLIIKANIPGQDKGQFYDDSLIDAIYYAVNHGAKIINMSLGGPSGSSLLEKAVNYAYDNGVAIVAAAGNDGSTEKNYPAAFKKSISVSAVNEDKTIASYSNFGLTITIAAPGTNILSSDRQNSYRMASGTSLAAPQVSGVLALMLSYFSDISLDEAIARLIFSVVDQGPAGKDEQFGYGLVNTFQSLTEEIYSVQFETFDGSKINPIYLKKGSTLPDLTKPVLEDYFFDGWYYDIDLNHPADVTGLIVNENIILYAKFTKLVHHVTFVTQGSQVAPMTIIYGETFNIPISSLKYHNFIGWTLDPEGTVTYNQGPVTSDLILYAQFVPTKFLISFAINDPIIDSIEATYLDKIILPTPQLLNYEFKGWFTEKELINEFRASYVTNNITLYPKFIYISYKDISLSPGVDTIRMGQLWIDTGLANLHEDFQVTVTGKVNSRQAGRYRITYSVYHQSTLITTLLRYVRVLENKPTITVSLNPSLSTINVGKEYIDTGLTTNSTNIEIINNVDSTKAGTYQIIYKINLDSYTLIKTRYVHVLNNLQVQKPIFYPFKRKDDFIET